MSRGTNKIIKHSDGMISIRVEGDELDTTEKTGELLIDTELYKQLQETKPATQEPDGDRSRRAAIAPEI